MNRNVEHDRSEQLRITMKEEIMPRRTALKSALAVGCGLLLPSILIGCDSRQDAGSAGAAPSGTPETGADSPAAPVAPAPGKVSQASVQYQTQPMGEQKCGVCVHFIAASNTCMVVEGQISPEAWCALWAQKA